VKGAERGLKQHLETNKAEFNLIANGDEPHYGILKHENTEKGNLLATLIATGRYHVGLAIGDRESDEAMFKALVATNAYGIGRFYPVIFSNTGNRATSAQYRLRNAQEAYQFFLSLTGY
jgi:hypothetical protein